MYRRGTDYPSSSGDCEVSAGNAVLRNAYQLSRVQRRALLKNTLENMSYEERLKLRKDKTNCRGWISIPLK